MQSGQTSLPIHPIINSRRNTGNIVSNLAGVIQPAQVIALTDDNRVYTSPFGMDMEKSTGFSSDSLSLYARKFTPMMHERGIIFLFLMLFNLAAFPEGTRQVAPLPEAMGWICIDKSRNDFGFYDASPEFRINITIADPSETINLGFGRNMINTPDAVVLYRLRDPGGNVVIGPDTIPDSGTGFISNYTEATTGPFPLSGGYDPVVYHPLVPGDYFLEFYYGPDSASYYTEPGRVQLRFFDFTVTGAAGQEIPGRLWSKAWQFNCGPVEPPPTNDRFWGTMYILSDDSIVTSVNCNGFIGGTFSISSNPTGCSKTGDISIDRQSREGFHTYPQYKIFLNDPDSVLFPTGKAQPGIILPITADPSCDGFVDLGLQVTMNGLVEVFLDINPNPGADPEDVRITTTVLANPGGSGKNIIRWNGINGRGKPVRTGTMVTAGIRFIHGITHLPMYDIEYNDNGYVVQGVRPTGNRPDIYWDDLLIPEGVTINLTGCNDANGCHLWSYEAGNVNTLNSWWYVGSASSPSISFVMKRRPLDPGPITGKQDICRGPQTLSYSVAPDTNATAYQWSYSGSGATLTCSGPQITLAFSDSATSGSLSVNGFNPECGTGNQSLIPINMHPIPAVRIDIQDTICIGADPVALSAGVPGGTFHIDGVENPEFSPRIAGTGWHNIICEYADQYGCSNADTADIFVSDLEECSIRLFMPDAFSPNGDGLNDVFRPIASNVERYSMSIFSRTGDEIFSSSNSSDGWDGRFKGELCPPGCYIYIVKFESSVSPPEHKTITGNLILLR